MINHIPCQNRRIMILVTAILSGFLLFAASGSEAMDLDNRVEKFVLSNGLTVLVMERHMSPTTALYIRYKVGAAYEQAGETGMAHFLEHMMFKGTTTIGAKHPEEERTILFRIKTLGELIDRERQKKDGGEKEKIAEWQAQMDDLQAQHRELRIPNEMDRLYTENGAEYFNANTSQDMTTYLVSLPANKTELWARIESDRMTNTVFRDFYVERQVVREERRQRTEANPRGALYEQFMAAAFTAHPYGRPVIGWASDMENLSEDAMTAFMKKYYIPSNTVIAVVGSVNTPDIMKQIQKYFGVIPAQPVTPPVLTREPPQNGERRVNVTWDANPTLMIGYHKPSMPHEDDYIFEFIETILTKGRTSRLHRRLVQEKGIAESVYAVNGLPGNRYPNLFVIMATPQAPHTNEKLEKLIYEELDRLAKEPVSEEELQKVKTLIRADYIRSLASNERLAEQLSYFEAMVGDYRYLTTYLDRMKTVTAADIQKAAKTYLTPENRTAATITRKDPSAKEGRHISPPTIAKAEKKESFLRKKRDAGTKAQKKKGVGTTADHLIPPEQIVYPPLDYQIPAAHNITLPSGIRLFILEDEERPLVEISVLIATGSAHDPQGREGLAELVCRSMRSAGITGTASNAVDDLLDHHAIHITTAAEMEISRFYLSVLKENLNTGMYIFSRILQSPAFEAGKVQTEKNLLKEGLRRIEDNPQQYAFREFRRHLYRNDPRGRQQTETSLDAISHADLLSFHGKHFSPANMMMAITGDITPQEAEKMISSYFPVAPTREKAVPLPVPSFSGDGAPLFIPKETPQSVILMGFPAPSRKEADYFAFSVLDFILGSGGFQSHIFREIRSNQGLAYSAGSFYRTRNDYGVLTAYAMTKTESANQALEAMKSIITHFSQNPPSQEELRWAKTAIINNFLFSFNSASQIARQEMMLQYDGLPDNFLKLYRENMEKVTQDDVRGAGEKYLLLHGATLLILGDEKGLNKEETAPQTE